MLLCLQAIGDIGDPAHGNHLPDDPGEHQTFPSPSQQPSPPVPYSHDTFIYYTYNNLIQQSTPPTASSLGTGRGTSTTPTPPVVSHVIKDGGNNNNSSHVVAGSSSQSPPNYQDSPFEGDHGDRTSLFDSDSDSDDDDSDYDDYEDEFDNTTERNDTNISDDYDNDNDNVNGGLKTTVKDNKSQLREYFLNGKY